MMVGALIVYGVTMACWGAFWLYRHYRPADRRFFRTATIAHNAAPLLKRHILPASEVLVTGGDGHPVQENRYPWLPFLDYCLKMGTGIRYFLVDPSSKTLVALDSLIAKYPGRLEVRVLDVAKAATAPPEDHAMLESMRTFHFMLVDRPKVMWLERHHAPGICEAEDCEFVPPEVADRDPRYSKLQSTFEKVWAEYSAPSTTRRTAAAA